MSRTSVKTATKAKRPGAKVALKSVLKAQKVARKLSKKTPKAGRPVAAAAMRALADASAKKGGRVASPPTQPIGQQDIVLRSHKYQVGEAVYFTSPNFGRAAATGSYTVVKQLPSEGDDYQYRIKSNGEAFERVAKESQLERM